MEAAKITVVVDNIVDPDAIELVSTERLGVDEVLIIGNDEETIDFKVVATGLFWPDVESGPKVSEGR